MCFNYCSYELPISTDDTRDNELIIVPVYLRMNRLVMKFDVALQLHIVMRSNLYTSYLDIFNPNQALNIFLNSILFRFINLKIVRVLESFGKLWKLIVTFSRTCKVLENRAFLK